MSTQPSRPIVCLGEALIDFSPEKRGMSLLDTNILRFTAGGAPANVAVALARLGSPSSFMGKVGDDPFGHYLHTILTNNGVDTSQLLFTKQAHTGLAFVSWGHAASPQETTEAAVADTGGSEANYTFYRNPSGDTLLEPQDIDVTFLKQAAVLQFGSLLLATEPSASAAYHAIEVAANNGNTLLSYDVNLRPDFWPGLDYARTVLKKPLAWSHIVKLNRHELQFLTGETDPTTGIDQLWAANHFKLIVVTFDSEGCFYRTAQARGFVPAYRVEQVADTIGAGDGFIAGLLDELRRGNFDFENQALVEQACRKGGAVGAITVSRPGAIPAFPTPEEVAQFQATQKS